MIGFPPRRSNGAPMGPPWPMHAVRDNSFGCRSSKRPMPRRMAPIASSVEARLHASAKNAQRNSWFKDIRTSQHLPSKGTTLPYWISFCNSLLRVQAGQSAFRREQTIKLKASKLLIHRSTCSESGKAFNQRLASATPVPPLPR